MKNVLTKVATALRHVLFFCRNFITAAETKLKAELKSNYLTQLDKKRLTMCKQELVRQSHTHTNIHRQTESTSLNTNTAESLP